MNMNNFSSSFVGWVAIGTGIFAILAVVTLILMAVVNPFFGPVNDILNSLVGISSLVLAWRLYTELDTKSALVSQAGLATAAAGAVIAITGTVLVVYGFTGFVLAGWYTGVGNALIGLWLLAFCYVILPTGELPQGLVILGFASGAFMVLGLFGIPGIFAHIDTMDSMPWYLYLAFFGYLGTYILYPTWAIWLGRNLLFK